LAYKLKQQYSEILKMTVTDAKMLIKQHEKYQESMKKEVDKAGKTT